MAPPERARFGGSDDGGGGSDADACSTSGRDQGAAAAAGPTCRLCWADADGADGGRLLAPCACKGSCRYIHERCLGSWLRVRQGAYSRTLSCELCKQPYGELPSSLARAAPGAAAAGAGGRGALPARLARGLAAALASSVAGPWPLLALRVWRGYVLAAGALEAAKLGAAGFAAGLAAGRRLVDEQALVLSNVLASMGHIFGSPYAELLWAQAAGALVVGMLSELVYTSVLGALAGATFGFVSGYSGALLGTLAAARAALRLGGRAGLALIGGAGVVALRGARRLPMLRRLLALRA